MLYAVKHNRRLLEQFKLNEDSFTSTIFERLMYLPKELFQSILVNSLDETIPALDLTSIELVEYWPKWCGQGTGNPKFVSPDLFIRTQKSDIIIEAKRTDINQQDRTQWENQVTAYYNEYTKDNKELIYIALGGIRNPTTDEVSRRSNAPTKIFKCKWQRILSVVKNTLNRLESSHHLTHGQTAIHNILTDIIMAFGMYGYFTGEWLEKSVKPAYISSDNLKLMNDLNNISFWNN